MIFVIRFKSFSVLLQIPYVKIQIFRDRLFKWVLNYYFAKFLKILTTGSLEISKFVPKQSVSIFRATAHALHLTGFFRGSFDLEKSENCWVLCVVTFSNIPLLYKTKAITHCVQLRRKIEMRERTLSK